MRQVTAEALGSSPSREAGGNGGNNSGTTVPMLVHRSLQRGLGVLRGSMVYHGVAELVVGS